MKTIQFEDMSFMLIFSLISLALSEKGRRGWANSKDLSVFFNITRISLSEISEEGPVLCSPKLSEYSSELLYNLVHHGVLLRKLELSQEDESELISWVALNYPEHYDKFDKLLDGEFVMPPLAEIALRQYKESKAA